MRPLLLNRMGEGGPADLAGFIVGGRARREKHGGTNPAGMALQEIKQDVSPHRHSPQDSLLDFEPVHQGDDVVGEDGHGVGTVGRLALAEPPQIRGDHPVARLHQSGNLRAPHLAAQGEAMDQNDRRPLAARIVCQANIV